jgi:large subunit ribosomal protein L25
VSGDRFRLEVKQRTRLGSPEARRLRKRGVVPGVLYGNGDPTPIMVEERALRAALTTDSGLHAVLDVVVEGTSAAHPSILKDYQRDPIRGLVSHIDLQEVRLDRPIQAAVTVHLVGAEDAPGVREGGVISQPATTVNVEALPMEIPESIEVDVTSLEMNDSLRLADVPAIDGVTFLDDPQETVIATIAPPRVEIEPEVEEEEAELVEGEEVAEEGEAPEGAAEEPGGEAAGEPGTTEG